MLYKLATYPSIQNPQVMDEYSPCSVGQNSPKINFLPSKYLLYKCEKPLLSDPDEGFIRLSFLDRYLFQFMVQRQPFSLEM